MNKLFFSSALLLVLLTGCGSSDGACCESMIAKSKNTSPKGTTDKTQTPHIVKNGDPVTKKPIIEEKTAPVAVITPNVQTLVPSEAVTFSCSDSYDTDENGETIIACEWTFECHKKDGYTCSCPKTGNMMKGGTIDFLFEHANALPKSLRQKWDNTGRLIYGSNLKTNLKKYFTEVRKLKFEIFVDWLPTKGANVTLDPTIKDKWGDPVARVQVDNHPHDIEVDLYEDLD